MFIKFGKKINGIVYIDAEKIATMRLKTHDDLFTIGINIRGHIGILSETHTSSTSALRRIDELKRLAKDDWKKIVSDDDAIFFINKKAITALMSPDDDNEILVGAGSKGFYLGSKTKEEAQEKLEDLVSWLNADLPCKLVKG